MTVKESEEMLIREFLNWKKEFKQTIKQILFEGMNKILINLYKFLWKITKSEYFLNKFVNSIIHQVRRERNEK